MNRPTEIAKNLVIVVERLIAAGEPVTARQLRALLEVAHMAGRAEEMKLLCVARIQDGERGIEERMDRDLVYLTWDQALEKLDGHGLAALIGDLDQREILPEDEGMGISVDAPETGG